VLGRLVSLGIELRKQRYNAAFDMRSMSGDWRGKVVALLSGAPLRVGSTGAGGWALTRVSSDTSVHQSDIALERLRIFDPAVKKVESGMVAISRTRPKGAMPHLVLHPGAGGAIKRWPVENWISLARALANLPGSVTFQFLGGPEDEERLQKITTDSGLEPGRAQVSTTFRETLQILADADLLVGLDSGAAHLAHLVGTPAITIFSGAHDPARWKALGDNTVLFTQIECAPCRLAHCKWETPRCMEAITPATVLSTIEQKLRALGWPAGLGA
jgi:ADP-heptose:LPS heptosyltransferase